LWLPCQHRKAADRFHLKSVVGTSPEGQIWVEAAGFEQRRIKTKPPATT
jgi:hypothetical protein